MSKYFGGLCKRTNFWIKNRLRFFNLKITIHFDLNSHFDVNKDMKKRKE